MSAPTFDPINQTQNRRQEGDVAQCHNPAQWGRMQEGREGLVNARGERVGADNLHKGGAGSQGRAP